MFVMIEKRAKSDDAEERGDGCRSKVLEKVKWDGI